MDIYLMLCIFFPLAGSAWYNYENANDCANFCPDLQVSAVSRSLLMSVIVGANFRLAITVISGRLPAPADYCIRRKKSQQITRTGG